MYELEEMSRRGQHAFLLKFWLEDTEPDGDWGAQPAWRGSIEHIESKRRLYFNGLSAVRGFLREHLYGARARTRTNDR